MGSTAWFASTRAGACSAGSAPLSQSPLLRCWVLLQVGVDDALVMDTKEEIFEMNNVSCLSRWLSSASNNRGNSMLLWTTLGTSGIYHLAMAELVPPATLHAKQHQAC